jgi:hypothetical protein
MVASLQSKEGDMRKKLYHHVPFPYTTLYLACGLSPFSVSTIRTVIALLHPRDELQHAFNRIRPQG